MLVGTDGSPRAERAVERAIDQAKCQGASLLIVAAFRESGPFLETITSSAKAEAGHLRGAAEMALMRAARRAKEKGVEAEWEAHEGDPAEVILDVAARRGVDLIVVGNRGLSGARRYLLGSVPSKVVHHAECDVLVVRTD
jgi:nucleotide-binding universal stress UspA family protein